MVNYENIVLHYFTVKIIALHAGFNEFQSQTIAEICQFLGDYNNPVTLVTGIELPELLHRGLAILNDDNTYTVSIRATGLSQQQWFEEATLKNTSVQREVIIPIHMLPPKQLPSKNSQVHYMTATNSDIFDNLISQTLLNCSCEETGFLVRAGILSHILMDMHTHMHMCGFDFNLHPVKLLEAIEGMECENVTNNYTTAKITSLPNVGFSRLSRSLDESWLKLTYTYGTAKPPLPYYRNNSFFFFEAANQVYRMLLRLMNHNPEDLDSSLKEYFVQAYLLESSEYVNIKKKWEKVFTEGSYKLFETKLDYNWNTVFDTLFKGNARVEGPKRFEMLTQFVLTVDDVIGAVYAKEP